ncbi:hypothetical protein Dsin_016699 [Dipteronia sinensis]|uniref:Reverse transcriptase zinc-binding domain-containing protein n=1 Tax=Dipteronia sinensis TaxID=43782 RepID=A0AAE0AEJ9_9ROSI|nr:hypothetical protein Dsin_016699 [Dipteronia sinensis]
MEKIQHSFFWGDGVEKRKIHLVGWDSICRSKKNGGLGVARILDMNKSLLAKWVWRYGNEKNCLWRKVLNAKYGILGTNLRWNWLGGTSPSPFVKAIGSLFEVGSKTTKTLQEGLKVIVGKGDRARFWTDICWDVIPLHRAFPIIFVLANNKHGKVQEFGKWNGDSWVWEVKLRRPLFDWELDQWRCFLSSLECTPIHGNVSDAIAWIYNSNGIFLVRSFRRCLEEEDREAQTVSKLIWQGICPQKIEVFVWQLIKGRIMVKEYMEHFDRTEHCLSDVQFGEGVS